MLDALASGFNPMQAARVTVVSKSYIYVLHHRLGGVYRPTGTTYNERYLDRDQRCELARLLDARSTQAEAARRIGCHPSTVSRELARNSDPVHGYQPERADRLAWKRQRRPKSSKITSHPALRAEVQQLLDHRFSPEQISPAAILHADNARMQLSHQSIYQSIYVSPA